MKARRHIVIVSLGVLAVVCSSDRTGVVSPAAAGPGRTEGTEYVLTLDGQPVRFVAEPQKGYVIKLAEKAGGIQALAGISALAAEGAREVRGLDRRGVWTVENDGPAGRNEEAIRSLRADGRVAYAAPLFSSNGETVAIIPEIVIRVKPGVQMEEVQRLCEVAGCTIRKRMEFTEQEYLLEVLGPDAETVFGATVQLALAPEVEWACPNTALRPRLPTPALIVDAAAAEEPRIAAAGEATPRTGVFPNDPYFPNQWHLYNIGQSGGTPGADIRAPEAWEITTGDPDIVIVVQDCGVDLDHPDLVDNLMPGYDFYEDDAVPNPGQQETLGAHGTCCAGLAAARGGNGIGVTGVAWNCRLMPVRHATWTQDITEADIARAIRWSAVNGGDVMSYSWGYETPMPIIRAAIQDIVRQGGIGRGGKGCVVLVAAGNAAGRIPPTDTAAYPEVIGVGATDHNDRRCWYSVYGPEVDLTAPSGGEVVVGNLYRRQDLEMHLRLSKHLLWTTDILGMAGLSSFHNDPDLLDYTSKMWGTSGATPIVAGVAALVLSIEPNLTGAEVRHFLERSAKDLGDPGRDDYYGWGRVDARAALDMVLAKRADLNNDWKVDDEDLAILNVAIDVNDLSADIAPAAKRDGIVDDKDLELLTRYLGTVIPELGLIAHWKLDEMAGTTAPDSAGSNNAIVIGPAGWQPQGGKVGGALQLSGVANFAMTGFVHDPAQGPFSVFAWVQGGAPGQVILSQVKGVNWLMAAAPDGTLATDLKESGRNGKPLVSGTVITDGDWHRIGLVWDGSSRILYVDGVEAARDTQASLPSTTGGLYLGSGNTPVPGTLWKGLIDDIRLYDRAVKP